MSKKIFLSLMLTLIITSVVLGQTYPGKVGVGLSMGWNMPFVDAAKTLRPFASIGGGTAPTDSSGWPTTDAYTVLWDMRPAQAWVGDIDDPEQFTPDVTGTYQCSFTGQATLTVIEGDSSIANQTYDSPSNTTTFDLTVNTSGPFNNLVILQLTDTKRTSSSATNTGITNLKVIRPGYPLDTTQIFTDAFLNCLNSASFSTWRTLGWVNSNNTNYSYPQQIEWSERKLWSDATQDPWGAKLEGACWESVIWLSNTADIDPWINIPIHASDDYITQLATLFKNNLNSNRNLYVEWCNEVWNWGFWQSGYNNDWGAAEGLSYIEHYAKRTAEVSNIFANVWGASAINDRVRVVNCWQIGWWPPDGQYNQQMQYINDHFGPPNQYVWALGVAPYCNCSPVCTTGSAQDILDAMWSNSNDSVNSRQLVKGVANTWNLPGGMVAYEGGTDTGGGDATNIANKIAAERAPGMKDVMLHDLRDNWFPAGGDLFVFLELTSGYNRYGSWGLTDDVTNPDRNYKFEAVRDILGDVAGPPGQPSNPSPADAATGRSINVDLSWSAGSGATSRDVYFGQDSTPDSGEFQGNQTGTTFDPGTLANSNTYYWRIDEINTYGTTTGPVWSFTTESATPPPGQASNPNPADGATDQSVNVDLSWSAGSGTTSHDVYFGTPSSPPFVQNQTAATYDPGTLANSTTYYWRIDEKNAVGTTTGTVWSFTTESAAGGLPSPWQNGDVGSPAAAGNAIYSSGTFTIEGDGSDIWGTSDSFHYVYQSLSGDGEIEARVASLENTNSWAKAGMMVRESLTGGSAHAMMVVTAGNGTAFQRRTTTNGSSSHTAGSSVTAPYWVRLVRSGDTLTGYESSDGGSWNQVGSATISMATDVYIGLALTSHLGGTLCTAAIDNVTVSGGGPQPPDAPSNLTATPGDGQVALNWTGSSGADNYNVYRGTGGNYYFQTAPTSTSWTDTSVTNGTTYWYYVTAENTAGESGQSNTVSATPQAGPGPGNGTGLTGDYYDNIDFTAFALTRTDATVNFDWGSGSPDPAIGVDTFSVQWTGQVQPLYSETYTFYTTSDDGIRLWVNEQSIIDNWTDHGPTENSGTIALTAGTKYDIQMDFYENGGGAVAELRWSSSSQAKEIIPQTQLYEAVAQPPGQASNPSPADAATDVSIDTSLGWTAGSGATSHDVYFGTAGSPPFIGNQTGTTYDPGTLYNSTTYYWRIDEVGAGGTTTGTTWSFTTEAATPLPGQASNPSPADDATNQSVDVDISWTAGSDTTSHDVYFGTTSPGAFQGNQPGTTFDPGTLANSTTYYWRIDEKNAVGTTTGITWSFTTASAGGGGTGTILREWWTGISGNAISDLTSSPDYPDNPTDSDEPTSFEGPTDWADNYGTRMRGYLYPTDSGDYTFWISSDDNGELWLSTNDNPVNASLIANVPGWSSSRQWDKYPEQQSSTISLTGGNTYYIEALQKEGGGGDNLAVAWQGPGISQTVIDGAYLSPWTGGGPTPPGQASNPSPADAAISVSTTTDLTWTAGVDATSHDVYFGDTTSPPFIANQTDTTYDPGTLSNLTTYYWRIDEKNDIGTTTGTTWSFTTAAAAPPGILMAWEFAGDGGSASSSAETVAANISTTSPSSVANIGSGLSPISYLGDALTGTGDASTTLAEALTADDYISWTIAPASSHSMTLSSIDIRPVSQNRERTFTLFSSVNGFTEGSQIGSFTESANMNAPIHTVSVTGHGSLTGEVEFRLYIYGYADVYEAVGIGNGSGDDLIINGTAN